MEPIATTAFSFYDFKNIQGQLNAILRINSVISSKSKKWDNFEGITLREDKI